MLGFRIGAGLATLASACCLVGCEEAGSVETPPPPPLAEGRVDPGPPSAIKAAAAPSRRLEDPGPRSAISSTVKGNTSRRRGP